jgi:hypothetical protein
MIFALIIPATSWSQECGPTKQTIGWSQPNNVPIESDDAPRWPTNASVRLAYAGSWCPTADQIELTDEEGNQIPAQIRLKTPYKLVQNAPDPLTLVEIDPIDELEKRTDYRVVIRPPDPALSVNREYILEFRTRGGPADDIGDFEGIREARLNDDRCIEAGAFFALDDTNPICPVPNRLYVSVDFMPLNRPDIGYVVYRTSSTPIATIDDPETEPPDLTAVPVAFENGARDLLGTGVPQRSSRLFVPYYPLPRRDCFAVMAIDEWGRERGDLTNESCVNLEMFDPCPEGCDPAVMMCQTFPEPNPFEGGPALPGQQCDYIGINGAEPNRMIPEVGAEDNGDNGLTDGGGVLGDGGMPVAAGDGSMSGSGSGESSGGSSSGCQVEFHRGNPLPTTIFLACLGIYGLFRRTLIR